VIRAHGRDGITVEMDVFQMWQVRDGKVVALRAFLSEREALEAVGLRDSRKATTGIEPV
jgi:ketosteroid isomerase-like protein